jgi:uncharacterized protein (DUF2062 family)
VSTIAAVYVVVLWSFAAVSLLTLVEDGRELTWLWRSVLTGVFVGSMIAACVASVLWVTTL